MQMKLNQFDRQFYNIKVLYSHVYHGMQQHTILYVIFNHYVLLISIHV